MINKFFLSAALVILFSSSNVISATAPSNSTIPNHAVILQYHHVSNETPASTSISVERFAEHIEYLSGNGYQVKSLAEVVSALHIEKREPGIKKPEQQKSEAKGATQLPDNVVVITFDDAYQSIYENAYPLLKEKGWPFTIFVNSTKTHRNRKIYLSWERLREMAQHGATIANHTSSHVHMLRRLEIDGVAESRDDWLARIERQITDMQAEIIENTGTDARYFAYPYGEANTDLRNLVSRLGFIGLGQHSGPVGEHSDFSFLPRFPMSGVYSGLKSMKTKLRTLPFPLAAQHLHEPVVAHTVDRPELTIKLNKGHYRLAELACYSSENGRIPVVIHSEKTGEKSAGSATNQTTLIVRSDKPIIVGRSRYNCTAPHNTLRRYYWFSAFWYRMGEGGRWIDES
ncbi:MAG: polysaccharide deacetylase family protein [Pseudomonadales bacterium]|nr:polysaccharide deacetylase family protein [Pseudomonadales bacterium]